MATWQLRETHTVGAYAFHWFTDGDGAWLIGVWNTDTAPEEPTETDFPNALTVHRISRRENPEGKMKPVREFCERFLSDIPFRVRAIRNKIPTLQAMAREYGNPEKAET